MRRLASLHQSTYAIESFHQSTSPATAFSKGPAVFIVIFLIVLAVAGLTLLTRAVMRDGYGQKPYQVDYDTRSAG
ncbi:MAG: hypothetical protein JWP10_1856 [Nocardioidaceae bacterium]|nr:hypothetical protein [Nocardioidaceae bacterium]